MPKLPVRITPKETARKIQVELDRDDFERVAAALGLYHPDFLKSLDRAEADVRAGRVKRLRALRDLRTNA